MSDDGIYDDDDADDSGTDSVLGKRGGTVSSAGRIMRPVSTSSRAGAVDSGVFDTGSTATPRRRPPAADDDYTWVNEAQNKQSLCRSCNQCPICKMPINVNPVQADRGIADDANWDLKWRSVQAWFKSKPAIFLDDSKGNRHIHVFGIYPGIGKRTESSNKCHYLHTSASGGGANFNGIWALCDVPDGTSTLTETFNGFAAEIRADTGYLTRLIHTGSMFNTIPDLTAGFLFDPMHVNTNHLTAVITTMRSKTFAGCWDCNNKMTQMNFIKPLFDAQFETILNIKQRDAKLNVKMNYILLSMQLNTENVVKDDGSPITKGTVNKYAYTISPAMQRVWNLKLGVAWCLMMIVFSHWNARKLEPKYRHHEIYILNGSADFYLSLLLYLVYRANYPSTGGGTALEFEEFHFFYATNFIFWLKHEGIVSEHTTPIGGNSLSLAIHHLNANVPNQEWKEVEVLDIPNFDSRNPVVSAGAALKQVYDKTTLFIEMFFKPFCQQLYTGWTGTNDAKGYTNYFASPATVDGLITQMRTTSANLNVHEFVNIMGPDMYWFHFKHITMQQISVACGESRSSLPPIFHQPFDRWCASAFAKVNALQCRLSLMQEHASLCEQEEEDEDNDTGLLFCHGKMKSLTL